MRYKPNSIGLVAALILLASFDSVIAAEPANVAMRLAPVIRLHPNEAFNPMDPIGYIKLSRLRHHRSGKKDQGWSKKKKGWVGGPLGGGNSRDKEYYDISVKTINSFGMMNGKNRRPRDGNRSHDTEVFLEPDGEPRGVKNPNRTVPVFFDEQLVRGRVSDADIKGGWDTKIQYWYFFGYNEVPGSRQVGLLGNHQGDWESVILYLKNDEILQVKFKGHGDGVTKQRRELEFANGRLVVYIARGTHASYPKKGNFHTAGIDHTTSGGVEWQTWHNLKPLKDQPWKDFAGAWGRVGDHGYTTGPLGPWHKRFE